MPRIELIDEVLYTPSDPIYWEIDNLPLKNILKRIDLVNLALDNVIEQMTDAIGTQGSLSNRLNQSINPDGSLKTAAIDEALHSIEEHADTEDYVRMTKLESDKLALIADEAKDVSFKIYTDSMTFVEFEEGVLSIKPSTTVTPVFEGPDVLKFEFAFPTEAAHKHYYGLIPVDDNIVTPDFINYKSTSMSTAYVEGSLKVFINGVRIFEDAEVYVPGPLVSDPWTLMSFTPDDVGGTFALSVAITEDDIIRIDFDTLLT